MSQQRRDMGKVGDLILGSRRVGVFEVERLLTVSVTAAAVVARLSRAHLVPGLRHVEDHAVAVEGLERERSIRDDARQEAGVRIALRIEDRQAAGAELAQWDLAEDAQALVGVA